MRSWFERVKWRMQKWMQGRYGTDELYIFLTTVSLVALFLTGVSWTFFVVALVLLSLATFRCYSKNLESRKKERDSYLNAIAKPKKWLELQRLRWENRKTHRYFKCSNCGQILRVPAGKGKIMITCPKCHKDITKKT